MTVDSETRARILAAGKSYLREFGIRICLFPFCIVALFYMQKSILSANNHARHVPQMERASEQERAEQVEKEPAEKSVVAPEEAERIRLDLLQRKRSLSTIIVLWISLLIGLGIYNFRAHLARNGVPERTMTFTEVFGLGKVGRRRR